MPKKRFEQILEDVRSNNTGSTLELIGRSIMVAEAKALAEALKKNISVTKINLMNNEIGAEGAVALADALKSHRFITTIDLSGNDIGAKGAQALAEGLKENTSVTDINLCGNDIGAKGAQALAEALKENTSVTRLDLESNNIGDEGAVALAEALKKNTSVTDINLCGNDIGAKGAKALAEALKENTSVTKLDLYFDNIGAEGIRALDSAIEQNEHVLYAFYYPSSLAVGYLLLERQKMIKDLIADYKANKASVSLYKLIKFSKQIEYVCQQENLLTPEEIAQFKAYLIACVEAKLFCGSVALESDTDEIRTFFGHHVMSLFNSDIQGLLNLLAACDKNFDAEYEKDKEAHLERIAQAKRKAEEWGQNKALLIKAVAWAGISYAFHQFASTYLDEDIPTYAKIIGSALLGAATVYIVSEQLESRSH